MFVPWAVHVVFLVDKVALGQVFSEPFNFPCQYHSTTALYLLVWGMDIGPVSCYSKYHRHSLTPLQQ
jgi:hypothetical protein